VIARGVDDRREPVVVTWARQQPHSGFPRCSTHGPNVAGATAAPISSSHSRSSRRRATGEQRLPVSSSWCSRRPSSARECRVTLDRASDMTVTARTTLAAREVRRMLVDDACLTAPDRSVARGASAASGQRELEACHALHPYITVPERARRISLVELGPRVSRRHPHAPRS
jgi:hypothetical protein